MSRVTRSRKVDIVEDQSATIANIDASSNLHSSQNPLSELPSTNIMAPISDAIAAELKGLKAAYRTAIGEGRRAPKRGRKVKTDQESFSQSSDDAPAGAAPSELQLKNNPHVETSAGVIISSQQDESLKDTRPSIPIVPERRTTRRQAAIAQGQFTAYFHNQYQDPPKPFQAIGGIDYITSLFGGRSADGKHGWALTDQQFLAERDLSRPDVELLANNGAQVECNDTYNASSAKALRSMKSMPIITTECHPAPYPTPLKSPIKRLEDIEKEKPLEEMPTVNDEEEDSFVEQIIARSPSKSISRIEDSVEALDELEDAIEALDVAALAEQIVSPAKPRKVTPPGRGPKGKVTLSREAAQRGVAEITKSGASSRSPSRKPAFSSLRLQSTPKASMVKKSLSMIFQHEQLKGDEIQRANRAVSPAVVAKKRPASMFVKGTEMSCNTQVEAAKRAPTRRPVSLLPPKEPNRSNKPVPLPTFELPGEAVARRLKEQREARNARREAGEMTLQPTRTVSAPRIKSSKAVTVSNFELPGEAYSRRKKEAHDAKLKAQEEEERKRREFKAKPYTLPRETTTSRIRQSRTETENLVENSLGKRNSKMYNTGTHRPSLATLVTANTSAPRANGPANSLVRKPSKLETTKANIGEKAIIQRTVSASDVQVQRERGKAIYDREAKQTEEIERERREREAAAKKAREDAAERGRQASREWAEKMMARKVANGVRMANAASVIS